MRVDAVWPGPAHPYPQEQITTLKRERMGLRPRTASVLEWPFVARMALITSRYDAPRTMRITPLK